MKSSRFILFILLTSIVVSACKEQSATSKTDSIFLFKEYISHTTYGVKSIMTDIRVGLVKPLDNQGEINNDLLEISPKTAGVLKLTNDNELIFQPNEPLKRDTEYFVKVRLDKIYPNQPKDFKTFTFSFKTIAPNFTVSAGNLQSSSDELYYLELQLTASDVISLEKAQEIIYVTQNGENLPIRWSENLPDGNVFNMVVDNISRADDNTEIYIGWKGKALNIKNDGGFTYSIPQKPKMTVVKMTTTASPQRMLKINFSNPLEDGQDFSGLVSIGDMHDVRYEVEGNVLNVYPQNRLEGYVEVTVFNGIKDMYGYRLEEDFRQTVSFEQLKPEVRMLSKGVILPDSHQTPLYFEAVNLSKIDVRIIEIYEQNVLQFLQGYNLNDNNVYDIRRVGRRIAKQTIDLGNQEFVLSENWRAYAIDLSQYFKASPGAIYQVELSFKPEYIRYECENSTFSDDDYPSYYYDDLDLITDEEVREEAYWNNQTYSWRRYNYNWQQRDNPCHPAYYNENRFVTANVLGSNLGMIVKKGTNGTYHFYASNLLSTTPESGVEISLYNYQKNKIQTVSTDNNGKAVVKIKNQAAFAVAKKRENYSYVKLEDGNALSMSNFDISGKELQRGLKGFLYTERGVYRPGDSIHLTFVLNDAANPLPKGHPITMSLTDARGKLVQNFIRHTEEKSDVAQEHFFYFPITTDDFAPNGNWEATVNVGGAQFSKTIRLASIKPNRLKVMMDFDEEILDAQKPITGVVKASWLQGAPARNLKMDATVTIRSSSTGFSQHPNYIFTDPVRKFDEIEMNVVAGTLSTEGVLSFNKKIEFERSAPGMLSASFLTKVYEGGGDFSMDVITKDLAPFNYFVGLKMPPRNEYESYNTNQNTTFEVVTTDMHGKTVGNRKLDVKLYRIEWQWWWNRGEDNLSQYEASNVHRPMQQFEIETNAQGKGSFTVNVPDSDSGRYLIRIVDLNSGHATGTVTYFYNNWWDRPSDMNAESAKMLYFSSDKDSYEVGDIAQLSFPSGSEGIALLSVENGTEVLYSEWIETTKGITTTSFDITEMMSPNVYVSISLLQPHYQVKNNLPMRLYGVVPITVNNKNTLLSPRIHLPNVVKPDEKFTVKVSEAQGLPMTYTLAIVDEGLLDLTRFKTPAIHDEFYGKEALGVKTFDMYDFVIGAYSGTVENIYTIGGGDDAIAAKNRKAERFKPVVKFLGPFTLNAGNTAQHEVLISNYVGSVRAMVVAGDATNQAYGSAEKTVQVKKPLMVLASLPRKLSPGERVTLPVTVFAMEKSLKSVDVTVKTSSGLKPLQNVSRTVNFTDVGEKIVNFEFEVLPSESVQSVEILAKANGELATSKVEIDVVNPNPMVTKTTKYELPGQGVKELKFSPFGIGGSNTATLEFSTLPPINFSGRMEFLIQYPYGCLEQITSIGFPQLYLSAIFDLSTHQKQKIQENVEAVISRMHHYQLRNGGLSYWPGENATDDWSTNYAGHFMLEARQKGYVLPVGFLNNWIAYQQQKARQWRNSDREFNSTFVQAYRLYTLALAGQPELAVMNRLRESKDISNDARLRLAAAYALIGKTEVANELIQKATIHFIPKKEDVYSYGSPVRNKAMALETFVMLNNNEAFELATSLAKDLSSDRWMSTQETAYALLAMAKMVKENGGKALHLNVTQNGKTEEIKTSHAMATKELSFGMGNNTVELKNQYDNLIYVSLVQTGKPPVGEEITEQNKLTVQTSFIDETDASVNIDKLKQGTEIIAKITVENISRDDVKNIALTQIFPSGWEIVNTSFTEYAGGASGTARYTDIRDDRVHFFFDLKAKEKRTFTVKLNASYLGVYYLPGTQAEGMYDRSYFVRNKGKWIEVVK